MAAPVFGSVVSAPVFLADQISATSQPARVLTPDEAVRLLASSVAQKVHVSLAQQDKSVCFSPFSIMGALALIVEGMTPESQSQFFSSLGLDGVRIEDIRSGMQAFCAHTSTQLAQRCYSLQTASGVAVGAGVKEQYLERVRSVYGAEIFPCGQDPEGVCTAVNKWVHKKTNGKISQFLAPRDVPEEDFAAAVLNSLLFLGKWHYKFNKELTKMAPFYFGDVSIEVPMMKRDDLSFKVFTSESVKMLELSFKAPRGQDICCLIFMPTEGNSLKDLESTLDATFIDRCREAGQDEYIEVHMPKINLGEKVDDLIPALEGIGGIFKRAPLPDIGPLVRLVSIVHQAKLKLDEDGVEGAAGTAGMGQLEGFREESPKAQFIVDHPFAFVIMLDNMVLFQGSVKDRSAFEQ